MAGTSIGKLRAGGPKLFSEPPQIKRLHAIPGSYSNGNISHSGVAIFTRVSFRGTEETTRCKTRLETLMNHCRVEESQIPTFYSSLNPSDPLEVHLFQQFGSAESHSRCFSRLMDFLDEAAHTEIIQAKPRLGFTHK